MKQNNSTELLGNFFLKTFSTNGPPQPIPDPKSGFLPGSIIEPLWNPYNVPHLLALLPGGRFKTFDFSEREMQVIFDYLNKKGKACTMAKAVKKIDEETEGSCESDVKYEVDAVQVDGLDSALAVVLALIASYLKRIRDNYRKRRCGIAVPPSKFSKQSAVIV